MSLADSIKKQAFSAIMGVHGDPVRWHRRKEGTSEQINAIIKRTPFDIDNGESIVRTNKIIISTSISDRIQKGDRITYDDVTYTIATEPIEYNAVRLEAILTVYDARVKLNRGG